MRILFVARRYWPAVGGVESFLRDLSRNLSESHDVTVLAHRIDNGRTNRLTDSLRPPPAFEPFLDGAVRIEPLRLSFPRRAAMAPLVGQVVPVLRRYAYGSVRVPAAKLYARVVASEIAKQARGVDTVHMLGGDLVAAAAVRAARLARVPIVITPFAHATQYGVGPADRFAYLQADRVVALLESDAAVYRRMGVRNDRIVRCGLASPGVPAGNGPVIRQRYNVTGPLVVFLGVRRPYKGFDLLLKAAPLIGAKRPDVTIAIVGPGPKLPEKQFGLRVLDVEGIIVDPDRAGWLEAADLLCLPSDGEIFPLSMLEAWSVGTPVLGSDLATLEELTRVSRGGTTAPRDPRGLADAILTLLADPSRLRAMGASGKAFWRRHTPQIVAEWHENLYAALVRTASSLGAHAPLVVNGPPLGDADEGLVV